MLGMSYDEILAKISEQKGVSRQELELKVKEKLNKFSDMISKEGAAHIIANEYGVKLFDDIGKKTVPIHKVFVGMRNVNLLAKVVRSYGVREFKTKREGKVGSFLAADETGAIRIVLWDTKHIEEMEKDNLKEGAIVKIKNAYVRENNGFKEVHVGSHSIVEVNPPGETVENVKSEAAEVAAIDKKIIDLRENEDNI